MKKFVLMALMMSAVLMGACNKTVRLNKEINVEATISDDKEFVSNIYGCYDWFETSITLDEYLDAPNCTGNIASVTNIFQVQDAIGEGYDVQVIFIGHSPDMQVEVNDGWWSEDYPMDYVMLTYNQAYDRLCKANIPKPHSRQCVLRKQVGPYPCNPQYIFGNTHRQVYVDAITGNVSANNPAFTPPQLE